MSCGPGEASGWPWKQKAGRSVRSKPCKRVVKQADMRCTQVWQAESFASTAKPWFWLVIDDTASGQVLHGMVGAVVTELHLEGLGTAGQCHDLVAQADTKSRQCPRQSAYAQRAMA